jgi:hypothetical protein
MAGHANIEPSGRMGARPFWLSGGGDGGFVAWANNEGVLSGSIAGDRLQSLVGTNQAGPPWGIRHSRRLSSIQVFDKPGVVNV